MNLRTFKTAKERRLYIERATKSSLKNSGDFSFDEQQASSRNCENLVGATHVPLGMAGPVSLKSSNSESSKYYIPLATTEGALVASVSRGCKAITESGGANAHAHRVGATRGPVFYTGSLQRSKKLCQWIEKHENKLKQVSENTSSHLTYKKVDVASLSNYVFLRFYYDTQDAMGLNMVTIATEAAVSLVEKETGMKCLSLAGNYDTDKKPAWINVINKRGIEVRAEAAVSKKVVADVLKTTPTKIFDVWLAKHMLGSALSGSTGFNGHFANIIAAIFIATGQDPAHTVEGSLGITTAEVTKKRDLYFSIYIPSLMVGTVGGGTSLATQKEALEMLGVYGGGNGKNSMKFAEIVAAAVLAGELSLTASLAERSLAKAHKTLGRGG